MDEKHRRSGRRGCREEKRRVRNTIVSAHYWSMNLEGIDSFVVQDKLEEVEELSS